MEAQKIAAMTLQKSYSDISNASSISPTAVYEEDKPRCEYAVLCLLC
mgnify:FL=1